jgi:hypothetical protein
MDLVDIQEIQSLFRRMKVVTAHGKMFPVVSNPEHSFLELRTRTLIILVLNDLDMISGSENQINKKQVIIDKEEFSKRINQVKNQIIKEFVIRR